MAYTLLGNAVTLGSVPGQTSQGSYSVAIGYNAGQTSQVSHSVAIGDHSGYGAGGVVVGYNAGQTSQGSCGVAVGGRGGYGADSVAIGSSSGEAMTPGQYGIAIGMGSGERDQGSHSVAVGTRAGRVRLPAKSVAIGFEAGNDMYHHGVGDEPVLDIGGKTAFRAVRVGGVDLLALAAMAEKMHNYILFDVVDEHTGLYRVLRHLILEYADVCSPLSGKCS